MKRTRTWIVCVIVIATLLSVIFLVLRGNSLSIALQHADLRYREISFIEDLDIDNNNRHFAILQTRTTSDHLALVHARKDALGFWYIDNVETARETQGHTYTIWINGAGIRRYRFEENPTFESEYHFAFCGNDAIKEITFLPDQLPPNSTVNVQQAGESYTIHLIAFSSEAIRVDFAEILEQNGCIS